MLPENKINTLLLYCSGKTSEATEIVLHVSNILHTARQHKLKNFSSYSDDSYLFATGA